MWQSQDYPCTCQVKPYSGDTDVVIRESLISSFYSEVKVEKLEETIEKLKINQSKLESDLENCKRTESALTVSQQATKRFTEQLEDENLKYRTENVSNRELILDLKRNQTNLASKLVDYKSTDAELVISQRKLNDCNGQLKDIINGKQVLQRKYELVCPWSEWSSCSKTCWGTKTRTDKCSSSDEQIKACNQDSSCPRSGKYII